MIRHVALYNWTPEATDEQKALVGSRLGELPSIIPGIVSYECGPDLRSNETNFEFAVVAEFASMDDFVAYRDHDAHQAVIAEAIAPIRLDRAAVQFEVDR